MLTRHVKGHSKPNSVRAAVNGWCDQQARATLAEAVANQILLLETILPRDAVAS